MRAIRVLLMLCVATVAGAGVVASVKWPTIPVLVAIGVIYRRVKRPGGLWAHGTASWASAADLRRAGFLE